MFEFRTSEALVTTKFRTEIMENVGVDTVGVTMVPWNLGSKGPGVG